ncbi:hypothetical protein G9A89_002079 [Geosiphon pyriformis]|nr:hypothetical protein G9A89_002079 [Geosiphon pyriformis]
MVLPSEFSAALQNFRTLNREQRKAFLTELVSECDSYDFHILQQGLQRLGLEGFDLIGALPFELSVKIFSQLNAKDLCNCRQASRTWGNITKDSSIWRLKCIEIFERDGFAPSLNSDTCWETVYQKLYRREKNWFDGRPKTLKPFYGHTERINDVKLKDNILVTGSSDRTVRVWDIETGECTQILKGNAFSSVDFLPKEKIIAASTFFRASYIWNMETGKLLQELTGHVSAVRVISLNKKYVGSCAFDRTLIVWEWKTGERIATIPADALDFRILDTAVVTYSGKEIKVFELPSGKFLFSKTFDGGTCGWSYFKNALATNFEPTPDYIEKQLILPASISDLKNYPPSCAHACDIRKGRMVHACRDNINLSYWQLKLLDNYGRSKKIQYLEIQSICNLYTNTFTTVDMDYQRIVVGCSNGLVAALGFDEN